MPLDPLEFALADVDDPAVLKRMLVHALAQLDQAGGHISSGYLRLKPERPVLAPEPRIEPVTP